MASSSSAVIRLSNEDIGGVSMSKRRYQAKEVNQIDWSEVATKLANQVVVLAIDVAKEKFVAALMVASNTGAAAQASAFGAKPVQRVTYRVVLADVKHLQCGAQRQRPVVN
jgi:hypothetical protein